MKIAIITGSKKKYQQILQSLDLDNGELILWKPDFSLLSSSRSNLPQALGEEIDKDVVQNATKDIHSTLSLWYRDKKGKDLSIVDNLSLGLTFESSQELLFYNACCTYLSLKNLSKIYDQIIIDNPVISSFFY